MASSKVTKKALLASAMSLILCFTMLLGTTYAWFTDSVTSGNNHIVAGNLDVDVYTADGKSIQNVTTLFNDVTLWEPGAVAYENLTVANLGTLALKYQLSINYSNENTVIAADGTDTGLGLSDVLKVAVVPGGFSGSREDAKKLTGYAKMADWADGGYLTAAGTADDKATYGVVIYWEPSDNDNDWNVNNDKTTSDGDALHIDLGVNLVATQKDVESDSFGPDYDVNAWHPDMIAYNEADLQAALANGGNIELGADVALTKAAEVPAGVTATLNLNGYGISAANSYAIINNGNLTVDGDGTISGLGCISTTAGKLTINGGTYNASSNYKEGNYQQTLYAKNSEVIINGGTFDATVNGHNNAMIMVQAGTVMTINGGTFTNVSGDLTNFDPYLFTYGDGGVLNIYGGTYYGGWRFNMNADTNIYGGNFSLTTDGQSFNSGNAHELAVYGGTFTFGKDATKTAVLGCVDAANSQTMDNGDGTYTVVPVIDGVTLTAVADYSHLYTDGTNYYVYDAAGLISMRNFWKANWTGNNMWGRSYNVMADIDATGYTWDNVWVNVGSNENNGFVFDGHGNTITGLTINDGLFSGTPNGGNKPENPGYVQNITFDGVKVVGDHFTGVLWSNVYNELVVENVTVINSEITGKCNVAALVGATVIDGGFDAAVTFKNCVVKNNAITAEGKDGQDPNGAAAFISRAYGNTKLVFEGTNVAEGNTITNNNGLIGGGIYGYTTWANGGFAGTGSCDTFTNWNGITVAAEDTTLADAINSGASEVVLPAGSYNLPSVSNSDVSIAGTKDTVITVNKPAYHGSNVTFTGVTVKGSGYATGVQHVKTVTYNDVTFEGEMCLYGDKVVFNNCTFKLGVDQYIWTYGAAEVVLNDCTFNSKGKALLVYGDSPQDLSTTCTTYINNCKFYAETSVEGKAAIEIDSRFINQVVYIDSETTAEGFDIGNISGNSLWNNKKGNAATVYVEDVKQILNEAPTA